MNNEIHIVSLLIHVKPGELHDAMQLATAFPNAECHADDKNHKFVLIFEAGSEHDLNSSIDQINNWKGILSSQLCYHHCEPVESLNEEICYATYAS